MPAGGIFAGGCEEGEKLGYDGEDFLSLVLLTGRK